MTKTQLELYLDELDGQEQKPILARPRGFLASIRCLVHQSLGIGAHYLLLLSIAVSQEILYQAIMNREIAPALTKSYALYKDLIRAFHSGGSIRMEFWWFLVPAIVVPLKNRVHGYFYQQDSLSWQLRVFVFQVVFSTAVSLVLVLCLVRWISSKCSSLERELLIQLQTLKGRISELLKFIAQLQTIGLGYGLHRPRSPLLAGSHSKDGDDDEEEVVKGGDLSCRAMRRRLFATVDSLHTSLVAQLESFSAEDEEQNFKMRPYHSSGLACPDLSNSSAMVALSMEALEQLVTALLVAAIRPQIRSLRLLLPSKIAASRPPLSSWPESFASSIALLSTAASTVIHLLQHVSFLYRLSQELSRYDRIVADIAPALTLPTSNSYPYDLNLPESRDDSKKAVSAYIQARGALTTLRRKVDLASQRLWLCERALSSGDTAIGDGLARPAALAVEALSGCQLHLGNEDEDDDIEVFASSLLPGKRDLTQLLSLLQQLRLNRHDPKEHCGSAPSVADNVIEQHGETVSTAVSAWVGSSQNECLTEFTVMESAPTDNPAGSIALHQDDEADANKVVDVYTGYIPSRRPAAKRVRAVEGCSDSNRDTDNDRTLTLLHELRRHLRGRSAHTVERVKALLDDDIDDDTPIAVKLRRAEPLNTVDAVDVDIGDDGPGRSGYVGDQPNAAQLLSHVDESISKYDNQRLAKRSLISCTQQKPDAIEAHAQSNFNAAQPLLSELFLKVRSAQKVQAAAVFASDSDNDADR